MPSLAVKYRPHTWEDVSEQSVVVEMLKGLCERDTLDCRNFLLIGPAGCGKAQPLSSHVLTEDGYIEMRNVKIGDTVFTGQGDTAKVVGIYPQGIRACYRLNFNDGSSIEVSDEHLNSMYQMSETGFISDITLTTTSLIRLMHEGSDCFYVHTPTLKWKPKYHDIPPYLLGVFIGGNVGRNGLTFDPDKSQDLSYLNTVNQMLVSLYSIQLRQLDDSKSYGFFNLVTSKFLNKGDTSHRFVHDLLGMCDCTPTEFQGIYQIPAEYYHDSETNKLSLLQGLRATGLIGAELSMSGWSYETFLTPYETLSNSICELLRSMSFVVRVSEDDGIYYHKIEYLPKSHLDTDKSGFGRRKLDSIDKIADTECQCIYVDHPDHTYITDNMTVTHNTTSARIMADCLNEGQGEPIEIDAASHGNVDAIREIVQQARAFPVGSKYKIFIIDEVHAVSKQGWSVFLKTLEESPAKTVFILCTTNPEAIPNTIISRVQKFTLSKISLAGIETRLKYVLDNEIAEGRKLTYTPDAINLVAKLAQGGMRDSLTLLDKALAYTSDLTSDSVVTALNLPAYDDFFELLNSYARKDNAAITNIVDRVYNSGVNFVKWFQDFHSFVMNIVKFIYLKDINRTMIPATYESKISVYNTKHTVICLRLANTLVKLNQELKSTQYLQETALTYLCTAPSKGV